MKSLAPLLGAVLLAACAAGAERKPAPPPASTPVLSSTEPAESATAYPAPALAQRGQPLASGLPATLASEAPMRAQPLLKATVLRRVPAGTEVRVLGGALDNADGRWLSVLVGDSVGWLPAAALLYAR